MLLFHVYRWSLGWMHQPINRGALEAAEAWAWMTRWYWRGCTFKRYCILQPTSRLGSFIRSWRSFCSAQISSEWRFRRLLHCGVQAREDIIEKSGEGWLEKHVQRCWVCHVWKLLCKVAVVQEHICITKRCTHRNNLHCCHYCDQVQYDSRKAQG